MSSPYTPPANRVVVAIGWQRHAAKHGCVFAQYAVHTPARWLEEALDPTIMKPGRTRGTEVFSYERPQREALQRGEYAVYTDLLDCPVLHPVLAHPSHPLRERLARHGRLAA